MPSISFRTISLFLLTPLREGRLVLFCPSWLCKYFYSRPCGRGDDSYAVSLKFVYPFLLTPLREGRPKELMGDEIEVIISTHAPAGGATAVYAAVLSRRDDISTHAPAGGATASA